MPSPRPRFTVLRLMIDVVIAAVALAVLTWVWKTWELSRKFSR